MRQVETRISRGSRALALGLLGSFGLASGLWAGTPQHFFLVSIDGLRADLVDRTVTPNLDLLISHGARAKTARTVQPAVTLPAHASLMTGQPPRVHGFRFNRHEPTRGNLERPNLLGLLKQRGQRVKAVVGKRKLKQIFPKALGADVVHAGYHDTPVMSRAIQVLEKEKPHVLFIHLPDVDAAGHAHGWGSKTQLEAVQKADLEIGRLFRAIHAQGILRQSAFLVTADHGGHGKAHGSHHPDEFPIEWVAAGLGFHPGLSFEAPVSVLDVLPTVMTVLGFEPPHDLPGRVISEALFFGASGLENSGQRLGRAVEEALPFLPRARWASASPSFPPYRHTPPWERAKVASLPSPRPASRHPMLGPSPEELVGGAEVFTLDPDGAAKPIPPRAPASVLPSEARPLPEAVLPPVLEPSVQLAAQDSPSPSEASSAPEAEQKLPAAPELPKPVVALAEELSLPIPNPSPPVAPSKELPSSPTPASLPAPAPAPAPASEPSPEPRAVSELSPKEAQEPLAESVPEPAKSAGTRAELPAAIPVPALPPVAPAPSDTRTGAKPISALPASARPDPAPSSEGLPPASPRLALDLSKEDALAPPVDLTQAPPPSSEAPPAFAPGLENPASASASEVPEARAEVGRFGKPRSWDAPRRDREAPQLLDPEVLDQGFMDLLPPVEGFRSWGRPEGS